MKPTFHPPANPLRRRINYTAAASLLALLSACAPYGPAGLKIDRSLQAKSQNSRVDFIVLHYTSTGNHASLKILTEQNVSSHYLITDSQRPEIYELVDENRRAWHAGISEWYGRTDLNASSIGIEIVNPGGSGTSWAPYSSVQIKTLIALLHDISRRHQVKPNNIVGHSDIAPQRKVDPGPRFPWKQLADAGLGRWYDQTTVNDTMQELQRTGLPNILSIQNELERLGYATPKNGLLDKPTKNVIAAFQMHYRPSRYDGLPDAETIAILKALK